jgi:hypothetical protein
MAHNFEILTSRTSDMLYLELIGDFDESSASKLLNILKQNSIGIDGILINARRLKKICAYGRKLIRQNLSWITGIEPYVLIIGSNLGQNK